jgi:hypothetical protein
MSRPNVIRCSTNPMKMMLAALLLAFAVTTAPAVAGGGNVPFQNGPTMRTPIKVFLIFWRGPCPSANSGCTRSFDTTVKGGIGNYETIIRRFVNDVGGTGYFNVNTQYFGSCPEGSDSTCVPSNFAKSVTVPSDGVFLDNTSAYAHAGTTSDPLQDGDDIQAEVQRALASHPTWQAGTSSEFFVFTPIGMNECNSQGCTFKNPQRFICGYHDSFSSNGLDNVYAFMPANFALGCLTTGAPNGQVATDKEIVVMSHEFFESISDPKPNADTAWNSNNGEIGDQCNGQLGAVRPNGSNVTLNGHIYVVQQIWSNDPLQNGCRLSFGPTAQIVTTTGGDNLRSNSTMSMTFANGVTSNRTDNGNPTGATFDNNSTQTRVFAVSRTSLESLTTTIVSHNDIGQNNDTWNMQSIDLTLLNPNGTQVCEQSASGSPLAGVTDGAPFKFLTPNCTSPMSGTAFDTVEFDLQTGNDDAQSSSEVAAAISGQPGGFCLKPSQNLPSDGTCVNFSNATDKNGLASWDNWTFSSQTFTLAKPISAAAKFGTLSVTLVQSGSGGSCSSCDNWDIQGITVSVFNSKGPKPARKTLLRLSNPQNGDNCIARLKAPPDNARTVIFSLDGTNTHTYSGGRTSGQSTNCKNNGDQ